MRNTNFADTINVWASQKFGNGFVTAKATEDTITFFVFEHPVYWLQTNDHRLVLTAGFIEIYTQSEVILRQLADEIFDAICTPRLISLYESNEIDTLPECLANKIPKIDIKRLTLEVFKKEFVESTYEVMNGESVDEAELKITGDTLKIDFRVDCGRRGIHRGNSVEINNRGLIRIRLCEAIEGGGVESELEARILKILS